MADKITESGLIDKLNSIPNVKRFVENELRVRDEGRDHDGEPLVTFSIRLGVGDMALLENLGSYLGHKKTPFASLLLHGALQDALYSAMLVENEKGRLDELKAHLGQRFEFEGGSTQFDFGLEGHES
jgi:hypothetical protein